MARKLVSLAKWRERPCPDVVEHLEDMLARAKRGEIRSVATVGTARNRHTTHGWAYGDGHLSDLVLAVDQIRARLTET